MAKAQIDVIQPENPEDEMSFDILADHIKRLSEAGKKIQNSRLNRRAIILLLKDATNVPNYQIEKILNNLPLLEKMYLKEEKKGKN